MANSDFAPWLKNNTTADPALTQLKNFADAHPDWPYHSNRMVDYVRVVQAAHDPDEDALLTTLERYFLTWSKTRDGWSLMPQLALLVTGLIVVGVIFWALFHTDLIAKLADADEARGLITFLFAFITISVVFVVVIAVLWMEKDEDIDGRFAKAKDIITILVGILGTVIGFYFGKPPSGTPAVPAQPPAAVSPTAPTTPPSPAPAVTPPPAAAPSAPGAPQATSTTPAPTPPGTPTGPGVPTAPAPPATGGTPGASTTAPAENAPPSMASPTGTSPPSTAARPPDTAPQTESPGAPQNQPQ